MSVYIYYSYGLFQKSCNHKNPNNSQGFVHNVCCKSNLRAFTFSVWDIQARGGRPTEEATAGSVTWCLFHQANHWKCLWNNRINSCCGQQPETPGIWWELNTYSKFTILFFKLEFMCNCFLYLILQRQTQLSRTSLKKRLKWTQKKERHSWRKMM